MTTQTKEQRMASKALESQMIVTIDRSNPNRVIFDIREQRFMLSIPEALELRMILNAALGESVEAHEELNKNHSVLP